MASLPVHSLEPFVNVLPLQRGLSHQRMGAFQGLVERLGGLPELEGAAVAVHAEERLGEAALVHPHAGQMRRIQAGQRRLGVSRVG